jgi:ketosteroid isomerase-like protein
MAPAWAAFNGGSRTVGRFSMTMTVREAFERGTAAFNAHDIAAFAEMLADDVVFEAPGGLRGQGKAACTDFFGGWLGAFPDAHVDVHGLHIVGDVAVEEGTFTGTHHGVLHASTGDIPPTGRPVRIGYIQVLRFRDGKHVSFNLMFDRLSMIEQLGLAPAPGSR